MKLLNLKANYINYDFDDSNFEKGIVDCAGITLNLEQCKQLYTFLHQHLNQHENLL